MATPTVAVRTTAWARAWRVIDERLGLSALAYPIPPHANGIGYILGGISFFGFVILVVTGIWLSQFYHAAPEAARQSVIYIIESAPLGDLARGIHFWTANVVMATVLLHLGRVFTSGAYKRPREANWLIGVSLLAVTIGLVFTGTVLKWDQEGYEALAHNAEVGEVLGAFGFWFSADFTASLPLLGRLYMAHIVILPALGVLLLIAHLLLVKRHGISPQPAEADAAVTSGPAPATTGSTFAVHLAKMAGFGLILVAFALVMTIVWAPALGPRPVPGVEETKPPWVFLPLYPLENWYGIGSLLWGPAVLFAGLVLLPFLDRSPYRSPARRRLVVGIGVFVAVALVALAIYAQLTVPQAHMQEAP